MSDLFFTANTTEFLKEQREKSVSALAGYRAALPRGSAANAEHLRGRIASTEAHIAAIDAELARRRPHA
jgi:hypothetical protein